MSSNELKLFSVTLNWNPDNLEEGDYATSVWAKDEASAIRLVAEEMAENDSKRFDSDAELTEFVTNLILGAGTYAAEKVAERVKSDIQTLFAGPCGVMSEEAKADLDRVIEILSRRLG